MYACRRKCTHALASNSVHDDRQWELVGLILNDRRKEERKEERKEAGVGGLPLPPSPSRQARNALNINHNWSIGKEIYYMWLMTAARQSRRL